MAWDHNTCAERLSRHEPTRTLRSTSKILLRVPTPREARRKATRERAFSVMPSPIMEWSPRWGSPGTNIVIFSAPGQDLPLLPGSKQCVLNLCTDPWIVVLKDTSAFYDIAFFMLFTLFMLFKYCILVFNVYCFLTFVNCPESFGYGAVYKLNK